MANHGNDEQSANQQQVDDMAVAGRTTEELK